jgi:hypothetical protein
MPQLDLNKTLRFYTDPDADRLSKQLSASFKRRQAEADATDAAALAEGLFIPSNYAASLAEAVHEARRLRYAVCQPPSTPENSLVQGSALVALFDQLDFLDGLTFDTIVTAGMPPYGAF